MVTPMRVCLSVLMNALTRCRRRRTRRDRFGNLTRKSQVTATQTLNTLYTHDLAGRVTQVTTPRATLIKYTRDAAGRVLTIKTRASGQGTDTTVISNVTYLPFGPVATLTYGNGKTLTRSFDQDYAIDAIVSNSSGGLNLNFTTNAVDNITGLTVPGDGNVFDYDALNRLTAVRETNQTLISGYAYDDTGNRLAKQVGSTVAYTYPSTSHRLTAVGGATRTYDAAGNTLTQGNRTYVYNNAGRLIETSTSGVLQRQYLYNARGERVRSYLTGATPQTLTVFDEAGHTLGEYSETGAAIREVVWLDDLPVAMLSGATATLAYLEPDHLGTPRTAIDPATATAIWKWNLLDDAFGEGAPQTDPDGNGTHFSQPLRFPGQYADTDTALNYNYFRDYEPGTGRYVQNDPAGISDGPSTYGYVHQSPLTGYDPLGLANYRGFNPQREADMRRAVDEAKRKLEECQTCDANGGNCEYFPDSKRKDRLIKKLNNITFIYKPDLQYCGYIAPLNMMRGQVQIGPPAFGAGCCSLAATLAHEVNHLLGSGESSSYELEEKCFGCLGLPR